MSQLKQKGQPSENTTHDRVLKETSQLANQLAKRWNCSKIEVYRWLVQTAIEEGHDANNLRLVPQEPGPKSG